MLEERDHFGVAVLVLLLRTCHLLHGVVAGVVRVFGWQLAQPSKSRISRVVDAAVQRTMKIEIRYRDPSTSKTTIDKNTRHAIYTRIWTATATRGLDIQVAAR